MTHNHKNVSHNVLSTFTILCWAAFIAILGHLRPMGHRLDTPAYSPARKQELEREFCVMTGVKGKHRQLQEEITGNCACSRSQGKPHYKYATLDQQFLQTSSNLCLFLMRQCKKTLHMHFQGK